MQPCWPLNMFTAILITRAWFYYSCSLYRASATM